MLYFLLSKFDILFYILNFPLRVVIFLNINKFLVSVEHIVIIIFSFCVYY